MGEWDLTREDFRHAEIMYKQEAILPLTSANMFRAAMYCLLSARENYIKQISLYTTLLHQGYDTPKSVAEANSGLSRILGKTMYPVQKEDRLRKLAQWWQETSFVEEVMQDVSGGKEREFPLRNYLAERRLGLSYKCASLFMRMCGYENVVPIDVWVLKYLQNQGHDIGALIKRVEAEEVPTTTDTDSFSLSCPIYTKKEKKKKLPDNKRIRGLSKREYLRFEPLMQGKAREMGVTPAMFQLALWCKKSSWQRGGVQAELFGGLYQE
jgi:thermostable 8-oxoguanine DNA glycosylase